MNIERLKLKALLSESKQKLKKLDADSAGLIILIRTYISPYEDDLTTLEIDKALQAIERLKSNIETMKDLKTKIKHLEEDLG
jgi:hypothetical protein